MEKREDEELNQLIQGQNELELHDSDPKIEPEPIDVFNDPLLPEEIGDPRERSGKKEKKARSGSFDGGNNAAIGGLGNEEDDINYDELDPNQKYQVLQHLYEEYQKDPDNFPEDQKDLLEKELKELFDQGDFEGEDEEKESDDER